MRSATCFLLAVFGLALFPVSAAGPKASGADAVKIDLQVSPNTIAAGGETEVTLRVAPKNGFKLNRYPKMKLIVPAADGLVERAEGAVGDDQAPPPDQLETNYFKSVEPLKLRLKLAPGLSRGKHEIDGRLSYFYCVSASGFCAPAKVPVKIPVTIR